MTAPLFPGGVAVSRLQVYDWEAQDGLRGGSPHLHTASSEGYVVTSGSGEVHTVSAVGRGIHRLEPGEVVWFSPGTVHRLVNHGGLELVVIMQNAGLPEAGDAVMTFPSDVLDRDGAALMRLVLERTASWSPDIRTMVANSDPSTVAALPLRTMLPVEPWPASPVTLIGDAIHNMTPMAGVGANTALRDAALLAQRLGAAGPDGLVAAIAGYEREMLDYGFAAVRTSLRNARQAASDRRLPRALFTTVLRTAEAVPAMKRRMFAGMGN